VQTGIKPLDQAGTADNFWPQWRNIQFGG